MSQPGTKLANQTLIFDEVVWHDDPVPNEDWRDAGNTKMITGKPTGLNSGMGGDLLPYWEFKYSTDNDSGLVISDIVVRDSQHSGSIETVFESITFGDLVTTLHPGTRTPFRFSEALKNSKSKFEFRQFGSRTIGKSPPDNLFQYGIKLTLFENILFGVGVCEVLIEISIVFRGANNDIDPGGIPVGMKIWPQIAMTWLNSKETTAKVIFFEGDIKMIVSNKMFPHAGGHVMNENIASFFTDSNTSMKGNQRGNILTGRSLRNTGGVLGGKPSGWGLVFDYTKLNSTKETEDFVVINDIPAFNKTKRKYIWPNPSDLSSTTNSSAEIDLAKNKRQMRYDNIHLHAKMHNPDSFGNTQIHAPFCGHSCIHAHWRWSSISSNGATNGRGWQFRGWSTGDNAEANKADNAPLVPPNQIIYVALTRPNTQRFRIGQIIDPNNPQPLDPLRKQLWYHFVIDKPNANEKQVTMDHGLGWAYRYSTPSENADIKMLYLLIHPSDILFPDILANELFLLENQINLSKFYEDDVYPFFRYIDGVKDFNNHPINQVPSGDYDKVGIGEPPGSMESI